MKAVLRLDRQPQAHNPYGFDPQEFHEEGSLKTLIDMAIKAKARAEQHPHVSICITSLTVYKTYGKRRVIYTFSVGEKIELQKKAFWL